MSAIENLIAEFEIHNVDAVRRYFSQGINPNTEYNEQPLLYHLIGYYTRSSQFKNCVNAFVDFGLQWEDKILLNVLLDDAKALGKLLKNNSSAVNKKYTLPCTYTPMYKVSLLHICAEFNHVKCARILVKYGANIDAKAGVDENGFGAQTPIFHTVNQNTNQSADMFNFLLKQNAKLNITIKGIIWGKGYEWETLIPSVNPISYAMFGLLPQMHRSPETIANTVSILLKKHYNIYYKEKNLPNKYLNT